MREGLEAGKHLTMAKFNQPNHPNQLNQLNFGKKSAISCPSSRISSQGIPGSFVHQCKKLINIIFLIRCLMSIHFNKFTIQLIDQSIKLLIQFIIFETFIFL